MTVAGVRLPLWLLVVAGCLIAILSNGVRSSFGLFLDSMTVERGWSYNVLPFALAIQNLLWGLSQPVAGAIADRFGAGRVIAGGAVIYAAGVWLMAHSSSPLEITLTAGFMIGAGMGAASFAIVIAAIVKMVDESKRSVVMGIGTAAASMGQFVMLPLGQTFITTYGWQTALVILALLVAMIVPLASALRTGPAVMAGPAQSIGEALREAAGHRGYVLLTVGFFVCGFHVAFITVHLPKYLTDVGIDAANAAWALAIVGLANIVGSFSSGVLGGRYSKKTMLAAIYFLRAVVIAALILAPKSLFTIYLFAGAMGLLWLSTVPLTSGIVAQVFGPRYMATLVGIVFFSHQIGSFMGVWLGGVIRESTGSYDMMWWLGVLMGVLATLIHLPIDEKPLARLSARAPAQA